MKTVCLDNGFSVLCISRHWAVLRPARRLAVLAAGASAHARGRGALHFGRLLELSPADDLLSRMAKRTAHRQCGSDRAVKSTWITGMNLVGWTHFPRSNGRHGSRRYAGSWKWQRLYAANGGRWQDQFVGSQSRRAGRPCSKPPRAESPGEAAGGKFAGFRYSKLSVSIAKLPETPAVIRGSMAGITETGRIPR